MNKKYFFFDIDHTLGLDISSIIPADTVYCLNRLKQSGHFVSIATGRLQCDAQHFADHYGIHAVVSDGGNSLSINGSILEMNGLPLKNCKALLHELEEQHLPWAVVMDNTACRYTPYATYPHHDPRNYMKTVVRPITIDSLTAIYKIMYARPQSGQPEPNHHHLPHLEYIDHTWLIEPTDKGTGVERMMQHLGADPAEAIVFGDGLNDISMFRKPFYSIAMGNGRPELKKLADYITDDNDKGGILHACIHFGWL
ncbi:MAG: HAD hydrolase family protein [Megasphaera sp.]|jgi:Cof subfamily protein (haloacid dehalogenase superfamily)|nr:HAD hydrolase family protein [Megasphaera sp.]MCH4187099.1 HAD hydrolase family protein [Megasphaera sp.]MCH4216965.1 HAD hydrolase family protein [Megasphaera sp.]